MLASISNGHWLFASLVAPEGFVYKTTSCQHRAHKTGSDLLWFAERGSKLHIYPIYVVLNAAIIDEQ